MRDRLVVFILEEVIALSVLLSISVASKLNALGMLICGANHEGLIS